MKGSSRKAGALVELGLWLGLALVAFGLSFQFADEIGTYKWGAASWPRAVILVMAVTALVHASLRMKAAEPPADSPLESAGDAAVSSLGLFLIPLLYAWLLPRTGFYLTTPFFLVTYLLYVGERRWPVILLTTAIITVVINLVFSKLFYVALPVGNWPVFYDVNNWLLTVIR